ncbi:MAG TPA: DUF1761 domain-containing protein [Candidatus Didemnitutus sp.]|nr:DUF1761 domain-containing protein [Candidatus Didemnitutus sp.]
MNPPLAFNLPAILVATLSAFGLGAVWYSPSVFGRIWMRESGFTEKTLRAKGGTARIFGGTFVLELLMAFNLSAFLGGKATVGFGALAGAAAGFGWVAASYGVTYLFEHRTVRIFLINAGYHAIALTLMGAILGAWS